jgi:Na+/H+ antiporter NhaC
MNKFVFIPLFLSPLVVAILSFYYVKKEKVREMNKYYTNMPSSEKSRLNLLFWLYVTASIIFFLSGVMSPLWL